MHDGIGVAVVGTGFMGRSHVDALRRLGVRVVGVLGSSEAKSRSARDAYGAAKAYGSFDELLADAEVTSVHIVTPNVHHYQMAYRALRAGKHVLCEKPLAMDSRESGELVTIARESGLHAGVNYNIRFYPLNLHARRMVESGAIGSIHSIWGGYVQDWLLYDTDYNWRVLADRGGALRAVSDIGTHWIDLLTFITGLEVREVFADLMTLHPVRRRPVGEVETFGGRSDPERSEAVPITTEDAGSVLFRLSNGAQGSLWVSQVTAGRKNCLRYEIAGAERSLSWNSESPNELWQGSRSEPNGQLLKDASLMDPAVAPYTDYPGGHNEGYADSFKMCFRAFYDRVAGASGGFMYPTFAEGDREIRICDAILASHRDRRWVMLEA